MNRWMAKVMWRFKGYITYTQSGFSMNRWVHGHGAVEVFRAVTTRERAVMNEENLLAKITSKMYSPKERGNILPCLLLVEYVFPPSLPLVLLTSSRSIFFLPENGLF